jgi:hypothetical protein
VFSVDCGGNCPTTCATTTTATKATTTTKTTTTKTTTNRNNPTTPTTTSNGSVAPTPPTSFPCLVFETCRECVAGGQCAQCGSVCQTIEEACDSARLLTVDSCPKTDVATTSTTNDDPNATTTISSSNNNGLATATTSSTSSANVIVVEANSPQNDNNLALILGLAIPLACVTITAIILVVVLLRRNNNRSAEPPAENESVVSTPPNNYQSAVQLRESSNTYGTIGSLSEQPSGGQVMNHFFFSVFKFVAEKVYHLGRILCIAIKITVSSAAGRVW